MTHSCPHRRASVLASGPWARRGGPGHGPTQRRGSRSWLRSTLVADRTFDLSSPRRIHVTNVGGAGMSAVATLLAEMGHQVSGHDPATDTPFMGRLRALGVAVRAGGDDELPEGVDAVVVSRSEEHTSELQSLMRNSYAVFCLKK